MMDTSTDRSSSGSRSDTTQNDDDDDNDDDVWEYNYYVSAANKRRQGIMFSGRQFVRPFVNIFFARRDISLLSLRI